MSLSVQEITRIISAEGLSKPNENENAPYKLNLGDKVYAVQKGADGSAISASRQNPKKTLFARIKTAIANFFGTSNNARIVKALNGMSKSDRESVFKGRKQEYNGSPIKDIPTTKKSIPKSNVVSRIGPPEINKGLNIESSKVVGNAINPIKNIDTETKTKTFNNLYQILENQDDDQKVRDAIYMRNLALSSFLKIDPDLSNLGDLTDCEVKDMVTKYVKNAGIWSASSYHESGVEYLKNNLLYLQANGYTINSELISTIFSVSAQYNSLSYISDVTRTGILLP